LVGKSGEVSGDNGVSFHGVEAKITPKDHFLRIERHSALGRSFTSDDGIIADLLIAATN
jgi:hypothetical protein